jgi:hypothetical protein
MEQYVHRISEIQEWVELHTPRAFEDYPSLLDFLGSPDHQYRLLVRLLKSYSFKSECIKAINELRSIFDVNSSLEPVDLRTWIRRYRKLGSEDLQGFSEEYFDYSVSTKPPLIIKPIELHIERAPFAEITQFYEIFYLLYWNGYDSPFAERDSDEPSYYSVEKSVSEQENWNTIMRILSIDYS